jgi:hypothetical protein
LNEFKTISVKTTTNCTNRAQVVIIGVYLTHQQTPNQILSRDSRVFHKNTREAKRRTRDQNNFTFQQGYKTEVEK